MALFAVGFAKMQSLIVDADDAASALELARNAAEEVPARVIPIPPGVFVAALFSEPEDEDAEVIAVEPFPHVEEYLSRVDDLLTGEGVEGEPVCGSQGSAEGEVVTCELEPEHDGDHEGTTSAGGVVCWATP